MGHSLETKEADYVMANSFREDPELEDITRRPSSMPASNSRRSATNSTIYES